MLFCFLFAPSMRTVQSVYSIYCIQTDPNQQTERASEEALLIFDCWIKKIEEEEEEKEAIWAIQIMTEEEEDFLLFFCLRRNHSAVKMFLLDNCVSVAAVREWFSSRLHRGVMEFQLYLHTYIYIYYTYVFPIPYFQQLTSKLYWAWLI